MKKLKRVLIIDVIPKNASDPHGNPLQFWIVLGIVYTSKEMSIGVNYAQGDALNCLLRGQDCPRIEIYDFFVSFLSATDFKLEKIILRTEKSGSDVILAMVELSDKNKKKQRFSLSSEDALVLGYKADVPIYAEKVIVDLYSAEGDRGIFKDPDVPQEEMSETEKISGEFSDMTDTELEGMLKEALEQENYEKATKIRNEINDRKG